MGSRVVTGLLPGCRLTVLRVRSRRRPCRGHILAHRHRQAERHRPAHLAGRRAAPDQRPPGIPPARAAALELAKAQPGHRRRSLIAPSRGPHRMDTQRRPHLPDQQCRRARAAWHSPRKKVLVVLRVRSRRRPCGGHILAHRHRQAERHRPAHLAGRRAAPDQRPPGIPPARAAALELAKAQPGHRRRSLIAPSRGPYRMDTVASALVSIQIKRVLVLARSKYFSKSAMRWHGLQSSSGLWLEIAPARYRGNTVLVSRSKSVCRRLGRRGLSRRLGRTSCPQCTREAGGDEVRQLFDE